MSVVLGATRALKPRRGLLRLVTLAAALFWLPSALRAQMTVTGRVMSDDQPVRGASVSIPDLGISTRTMADGRYNFLIRAAQVRGQTVTIVARHSRYGSQSAPLALTGGAAERDFVLTRPDQRQAPPGQTTPRQSTITVPVAGPGRLHLDSSAFEHVVGPLDVASALAGKIPGLVVTTASGPSGSAPMIFRGIRSLGGPVQPLVVVDGMVIDNIGSVTAAQRFGLGGFDYGTALQDIALDDIASVSLLDQATATALFGSRAANGVLSISTKQAGGVQGLLVTATQRYSSESPGRLPSFQNRYGQGLDGQFEFFDGRGGGINDAVAQSWGPSLDGQPIAQASVTEPGRPDVRYWLAHPSGVRDYFGGARTLEANVAVLGSRQSTSGRAAVNVRDATGLTPSAGARRIGLTLSGLTQPSSRLTARGNLRLVRATSDNRPGTGFDEINPVAGFTGLGRQVDVDALRSPVLSSNEQINWIYTTSNNPFFQSTKNSNDDTRTHTVGSASVGYDLSRELRIMLHGGVDDGRETRNMDVAQGWVGEYPTVAGRRDFSGGGTQRQTIAFGERALGLALQFAPRRAYGLDLSGVAGIETRHNRFQSAATVSDTASVTIGDTSTTDVTAFSVRGTASSGNSLFVDAGVRLEQSSAFSEGLGTAVFPSISLTYDVAQASEAVRRRLGTARIRAAWWRAGNEINARSLVGVYAGGGTTSAPTVGVGDSTALPERTTGLEVSTELAALGSRIVLELAAYRERSRELLVAAQGRVGSTAEISNDGYELQIRAVPFMRAIRDQESRWDLIASVAHNSNSVDQLISGFTDVPLGPSISGAWLLARLGKPVGTIVGTRYLRDSVSKALVLKNGLPIPDESALYVLGSSVPDWSASLRNRFRIGAADVALLFDGRFGGKIFSMTNQSGSFAGTLESTLTGRETGITVAGIDTITRAPNTTAVSAQDYFHALAVIHEPWVYDGSYWKLRELSLTYALPLRFVPVLREQVLRASIVGRNLFRWQNAPNIDPESAISNGVFQGFEMGQLPGTKSLGFQLSIAP